jgi:hypothetical protein
MSHTPSPTPRSKASKADLSQASGCLTPEVSETRDVTANAVKLGIVIHHLPHHVGQVHEVNSAGQRDVARGDVREVGLGVSFSVTGTYTLRAKPPTTGRPDPC